MVRGPAMAPVAGPGTVVGSAAALAAQEEMRWRQLDSGVSAVSFGFVATAILVSMFLAMAILEHFFRAPARGPGMVSMVAPPPPPPGGMLSRLRLILHGRVAGAGAGEAAFPGGSDLEAARKLDGRASPEMPVYAKGVSVLMPGHDVPTFIAHPAPAPCPPERIQWPSHQPTPFAVEPTKCHLNHRNPAEQHASVALCLSAGGFLEHNVKTVALVYLTRRPATGGQQNAAVKRAKWHHLTTTAATMAVNPQIFIIRWSAGAAKAKLAIAFSSSRGRASSGDARIGRLFMGVRVVTSKSMRPMRASPSPTPLVASAAALLLLSAVLPLSQSYTYEQDVFAINGLYTALGSPTVPGWVTNGGDPCTEGWQGVDCLSGSIPSTLSTLTLLTSMSLNNNRLVGEIPDAFSTLTGLANLDFSSNNLTGPLPPSMGNLTALTSLHIQNNQRTGLLNVLQDLPLQDFTKKGGREMTCIQKASRKVASKAWEPKIKEVLDIKEPSPVRLKNDVGKVTASNVISHAREEQKLNVSSAADSDSIYTAREERKSDLSMAAAPHVVEMKQKEHVIDMEKTDTFVEEPQHPSQSAVLRTEKVVVNPSVRTKKGRVPSVGKLDLTTTVKSFSIASLQQYTNSFSEENLIRDSRFGKVYLAEVPDGELLEVLKIDAVNSRIPVDAFLEMVVNISELRHPNILGLVGYCAEFDQRLLVYEHGSKMTLHDELHYVDDSTKALSWNARLQVAVGAAKALQYLHDGCQPPIVHQNFEPSIVLLNSTLVVHISECGLAVLSSKSVSQLSGRMRTLFHYEAPEVHESGSLSDRSDVYSFGVVMLELLTGRKPYDSSRPRAEQHLVRWATSQLYDIDAISKMVDPSIRGQCSEKALSRFADIISSCIQHEPEFRPPMSEVVQDLARMECEANLQRYKHAMLHAIMFIIAWFDELRKQRLAKLRSDLKKSEKFIGSLQSMIKSLSNSKHDDDNSEYHTSHTESCSHNENIADINSSSKELSKDRSSAASFTEEASNSQKSQQVQQHDTDSIQVNNTSAETLLKPLVEKKVLQQSSSLLSKSCGVAGIPSAPLVKKNTQPAQPGSNGPRDAKKSKVSSREAASTVKQVKGSRGDSSVTNNVKTIQRGAPAKKRGVGRPPKNGQKGAAAQQDSPNIVKKRSDAELGPMPRIAELCTALQPDHRVISFGTCLPGKD
ncbi:hypothetical protein GUJ93_ZPchr0007g3015 [Zizania palustris]|uniref:non-specific serine/threonine protein kinase n=1 Tax=Zizania palustris TaxID=103762 RepID=A0A8J5TFR5_ZIZPA|nr:hypothetical protein GUJ93_ZPchr0007g3015 [Zizania palustris]